MATASVDFMNTDLLDLEAKALLAAATEAERASRLAEVAKLELLSLGRDPLHRPDRGT